MKTSGIPRPVRTFLAATATSLATGGTLVHAKELPQSAKAFTNSLGMKMVPVKATPGLLWCVWETRNSDFEAYLADRGPGRRKPWFEQGADHPVVNLTRSDALDFCDWLTIRDIDAGLIPPQSRYSLPGDLQWSAVAGMGKEDGSTPAERNLKVTEQWIWGSNPYPPNDYGNLPDEALQRKFGTALPGLKAYDDGHPFTAPVGSYAPDANGLCDLGGNVSEWVMDQGKRQLQAIGKAAGRGAPARRKPRFPRSGRAAGRGQGGPRLRRRQATPTPGRDPAHRGLLGRARRPGGSHRPFAARGEGGPAQGIHDAHHAARLGGFQCSRLHREAAVRGRRAAGCPRGTGRAARGGGWPRAAPGRGRR